MNLKNKIIVITGGSSGLGEALARASAQQGARVIITSKNSSRLKKLAKELGLLTVVADVTKENQVKRVVNAALKAYGRIDIWINNAGISMDQGPLESLDLAQARAVMEVNYFGTLIGCRQALRALSRGGTIVNILSLGCFNPHPNAMSVNYYASKFAADALTRSLQPTLKERKIKVIGVYPGGFFARFASAGKLSGIYGS